MRAAEVVKRLRISVTVEEVPGKRMCRFERTDPKTRRPRTTVLELEPHDLKRWDASSILEFWVDAVQIIDAPGRGPTSREFFSGLGRPPSPAELEGFEGLRKEWIKIRHFLGEDFYAEILNDLEAGWAP